MIVLSNTTRTIRENHIAGSAWTLTLRWQSSDSCSLTTKNSQSRTASDGIVFGKVLGKPCPVRASLRRRIAAVWHPWGEQPPSVLVRPYALRLPGCFGALLVSRPRRKSGRLSREAINADEQCCKAERGA
jgi:hypothetical protein